MSDKPVSTVQTKADRWDWALRFAPEAFRDALEKYPTDTEGALIFFGHAIGLGIAEPTEADIAWAQDALKRHGRAP